MNIRGIFLLYRHLKHGKAPYRKNTALVLTDSMDQSP